jgi:small subunit ribosomal protein S16
VLRIRLRRVGKKKQPMYRLVVADSKAPRDGASVEVIGRYNPLTEPATLEIDEEKALSWLRRGAQPSEAAAKLLARQGILKKAEKASP